MNEFWRLSKLQHFHNVLHLKHLSSVLFIVFLVNQSLSPINAAVALSKRDIDESNAGLVNVINATTEHPILFDEKNVINITNKSNTNTLQSSSPITTENNDNKIPKEIGSHDIDDQVEPLSAEGAEGAPGQADTLVKSSSTNSSSSISEHTKDTSHTVVDHRLPLTNSEKPTSATTIEPIEKLTTTTTTTPIPSIQTTLTPATTTSEATSSTRPPAATTTRTTLRIKSEDILELSTRNPLKVFEIGSSTQNSSPRIVLPQSVTTESLANAFKSKPNGRSEQSSQLNQTGQSTSTNKTNTLGTQFENNYNNIKDEKSNNPESRANIQFQKTAEPVRNQSSSSESVPNPEIVTEKRAKYLLDHSVSLTLTTSNPLSETWSSLNSLKTVGEVNHNNVTFPRSSDAEDPIKKLADWAEAYQDNADTNQTLFSLSSTTPKQIQETNLHNQDLKINTSRIDEIGHQDNFLTSEHITTTPLSTTHHSAKVNVTTERGSIPRSTQKSARIQQMSSNDTNAITSTTVRNGAAKLELPKSTFTEQTTLPDVQTTDVPEAPTTTDKTDDTTLLDLATMTPTELTEASVIQKINKTHLTPIEAHTTARSPVHDTTATDRHQDDTTIFTEFFTTSTVLSETTTDTNDIPMLPTDRVPVYQKPTEKLINFDSSLEKDVSNKQFPITTEKETIHISPTAQPTTKEPIHETQTVNTIYHQQPSKSPPSDIAQFDKINSSNPVKEGNESTTITEVAPEQPEGIGDDYLRGEEADYNTIIAISVSCVGLIALILLITFLVIMRKRQKQLTYGQRCRPVGLDAYSLDNISVYNSVRRKSALRSSKRAYGNAAFDDPALKNNPLNAVQLAAFVKKRTAIFDEFKDVPPVTARIDEVPAGCEDKNRYANIVPLPESRVHLKPIGDDEKSEYINANFVKGPKDTTHYYIACQAPLENTIVDFWRMMWEQNSRVIIMATDLTENGIEKCAEYLPPSFVVDNHVVFGDYQITLKNREVHEKYAVSQCHLKNLVTKTWREITHFWYQWPESGVPTEEASLIAMLLEARSYLKMVTAEQTNGDLQESSNNDLKTGNGNLDKNKSLQKVQGPLTVHCSPGTGRTGTVIACDIAVRALEQPSRSVDIPQIVYCVRRGRASAVQTREQYEFIYKIAHMYATKLTGPTND